MRRNKYLDISLSDEAIAKEEFKNHLGGGADNWEARGTYQLALMKHLGLRPEHRFVDYGCGPIRAGRNFIRHQDRGCYWGCDVNADFIRASEKIVAETPELTEKAPTLRHAPDLLVDMPEFDVMLFFSVLNFCKKPEWKRTMEFARTQPVGAVIWITHGRWIDRLSPEDLAGLDITRLSQDDLPDALRIDRHGWTASDRDKVFPIIGLRRARA